MNIASVTELLSHMVDPRGRCNRKAFLHIALAFLALQTGVAALFWLIDVEMSRTVAYLLNAPIFWLGTSVCIKRLHDVGRRGWWLPAAFAIWFVGAFLISMVVSLVLGAEALVEGQLAFLAVFAAITLPAFGALIWLHTAPSIPHGNRFGPVPTGAGLSMPVSNRHARQTRTFYAAGVLA